MSDQSERSYTLVDLVAIMSRWRRAMAATFFAVFIPAAAVTFLMPPVYEATATILVSRQTSTPEFSVKSPTTPELGSVIRTLERKEEVNAKIEALKGRATIEPVIDKLAIDEAAIDRIRDARRYVRAVYKWVMKTAGTIYDETKYAIHLSTRPTPAERAFFEREQLVNTVMRRVRATNLPDSTVIEASFRASDPLLASTAINHIAEQFVERDASVRDARARGYFDEESQRKAVELRDAEQQLEQAKRRSEAYSSEEQRKLLLSSMNDIANRRKALAASRARFAARVDVLAGQLEKEPERIIGRRESNRDPALDDLRREVVGLEMQRSTASQQFLPEAVPIQDLDARIREARQLEKMLQSQLEGSVTTEVNPVREGLRQHLLGDRAELSAAIAEERVLAEQLRDFEQQLARLSQADLELQNLGRDVAAKEESYMLAVRNRQQARTTENMAGARLTEVRIVNYASLPLSPIRPRKWLYLAIALAAALLAAGVAPFFAEFNSLTFTSEEDVRGHLGSLVVAAFPARLSRGRTN
ncbi:MAG TPA: Wzz/FepE/Etk N-terminal domain-containing protein [Vicinamibacterales bacterium]|nr:Wzz/FepE/Etk N-terminal domain-containing protein [Vicinamibacterales bacterium]